MHVSTHAVSVAADRRYDFVDLTSELCRVIESAGIAEGCAVAYCSHTTCGLLINEWEDGALQDLHERLDALVPPGVSYAHDDFDRRTQNMQGGQERKNGRAHVAQMILGGTSHAIPIVGGQPALGTWQRLFLLELDEPKQRRVLFHVFGTEKSPP